MKKLIKMECIIIIVFAIIIILLCPCIIDIDMINMKMSTKAMIIEMKSEVLDEPEYFSIEKTLELLPDEVISMIYNKGIKIDTTTELGKVSDYGRVTSKYNHRRKKIIIQKVYSNEVVLLHETGHAYSYNKLPFLKLSDMLEFKEIYKGEKDIIFPNGGKFYFDNFNVRYEYVKVNAEEYFAQCFAMYFLGLLSEDTETYAYFHEKFN